MQHAEFERSNVTLIVEHNGRLYCKGPYKISATTSEGRTFKEVGFITGRFLKEIAREIAFYEGCETGRPGETRFRHLEAGTDQRGLDG